ncbi:MAG: FAD-binding and (Fe-S)-binding domain-containing protein [Phycisphaerales bacterium]|nr:FAD-binding and (Fe-S)-binding domain-containing protein [Phycisphaerales bacterium]
MIPQLPKDQHPNSLLQKLFVQLRKDGFQGDLSTSEVDRTLAATDNSIWEQTPQAVIAPKSEEDVAFLLRQLATREFQSIKIAPRGGGTSTAGQSLTDGISLDCKKYLNRILHIDVEAKQVTVECGVILATLNKELATYGLMFGPTVATADRATIGGMIGNDSAGKGSAIYGKTSGSIVSLTTVLRGGIVWETKEIHKNNLDTLEHVTGIVGDIHSEVRRACETASSEYKTHWPALPRYVTGYNLPMGWDRNTLNLNYILCGSEGTLGVTTKATLQCVAIPKSRTLLVVGLESFDAALRLGANLTKFNPTAVEVVDERVITSAIDLLPSSIHPKSNAVLFIECEEIEACSASIKTKRSVLSAHTLVEERTIQEAWDFRNKSVGFLSASGTSKRPIPFVEDCAVPPENLADFIAAFRTLLESHQIGVGMFGHVDAGVIHVRPALDLRDTFDHARIRTITEQVVDLVHSYGGVLWGEHGKGFRSEFAPKIFGDLLWAQMCRVKSAFDPTNQFNPSKVATPSEHHPLASVDSNHRGITNASAASLQILDRSLLCDANSQCRSVANNAAMCPSYQATNDQKHSPRGRAELIRHILQRIGKRETKKKSSIFLRAFHRFIRDDFSHDVYESLHGCLGCKACVHQCPMQLDIPHMRAVFLDYYYERYPRPLRDFALFNAEKILMLKSTWIGKLLLLAWSSSLFGLVDIPKVHTRNRICTSSVNEILNSKPDVVLLQDTFTSCCRPQVVSSFIELIETLGLQVSVLPLRTCGKALHVRGHLKAFRSIANANTNWLRALAEQSVSIVGIDPAATLLWRDEYPKVLGENHTSIPVLLPQEWLLELDFPVLEHTGSWKLFPHCIESSVAPESSEQWSSIFERCGIELEIMQTSCCGMGGMFGHEKEHRDQSIAIWHRSWGSHAPTENHALTTGFSCFSQAKRIQQRSFKHPLEVLSAAFS